MPNRTVEEFVDQHLQYERYKTDKVNEMREMIKAKTDKENTFQPNVINNGHNDVNMMKDYNHSNK